ncbi:MAG: hypothetical protein GX496_00810 [Firmicutes bacterium]|nr:hypothetical protein [Bacillota bacterium]
MNGLVRHRCTRQDSNPRPWASLWSALQLALLSTALYYLLGVGAVFRFES